MKDNYEPANVVDFGSTEKMVLGSKPPAPYVESILGMGYYPVPLPDDIDESDD